MFPFLGDFWWNWVRSGVTNLRLWALMRFLHRGRLGWIWFWLGFRGSEDQNLSSFFAYVLSSPMFLLLFDMFMRLTSVSVHDSEISFVFLTDTSSLIVFYHGYICQTWECLEASRRYDTDWVVASIATINQCIFCCFDNFRTFYHVPDIAISTCCVGISLL